MTVQTEEFILQGRPISKGIAIGRAFFLSPLEEKTKEKSITQKEIDLEIKKYRKALQKSKKDLLLLQKMFAKESSKPITEILDAQIEILKDPYLTESVEEKIKTLKKSSQFAFQSVIGEYKKRFSKIKDDFFEDRIKDIIDVSHRVLKHLKQTRTINVEKLPSSCVILAKEITPTEAAEAASDQIQAFVTQDGSIASHAAIIARAKAIPFIANVDLSAIKNVKIDQIIVDGVNGNVIINPSRATLKKYHHLLEKLQNYFSTLEEEASLPPLTKDEVEIQTYSTVEVFSDVDISLEHGAKGIGLFRSEFLFLTEKVMPTEEMQFRVYKQIAEKLKDKPFVIRIFDVGGEKDFLFSRFEENTSFMPHEINPVLGCRSIRFLLRNEEILKTQLRAIIRASHFGDVQILLPMVSDVTELQRVKSLVKICQKELKNEKVPFSSNIPIGVMIEVPASAIIADFFLEEADFLSIGTNDLTQYVLAADRNNPLMCHLYHCAHPSLLRILLMVQSMASSSQKPIYICGEMAADPKFMPLLIGMGFRHFSVGSCQLPTLKHTIRSISLRDSKKLLHQALELKTANELQDFLLQNENVN